MPKRKLTCHCEGVEAQVEVPKTGFEKIMICKFSIWKRKAYKIGIACPKEFKKINFSKSRKSSGSNTIFYSKWIFSVVVRWCRSIQWNAIKDDQFFSLFRPTKTDFNIKQKELFQVF